MLILLISIWWHHNGAVRVFRVTGRGLYSTNNMSINHDGPRVSHHIKLIKPVFTEQRGL